MACLPWRGGACAGKKCFEGRIHGSNRPCISGSDFSSRPSACSSLSPLVHGRAVRLTTRRLEATIPLSMAEVHADKDLLRAEFAMSTRRLETNVEQLKTESASQLAELGRKGDAMTGSRSSSVRCVINWARHREGVRGQSHRRAGSRARLVRTELQLAKRDGAS